MDAGIRPFGDETPEVGCNVIETLFNQRLPAVPVEGFPRFEDRPVQRQYVNTSIEGHLFEAECWSSSNDPK